MNGYQRSGSPIIYIPSQDSITACDTELMLQSTMLTSGKKRKHEDVEEGPHDIWGGACETLDSCLTRGGSSEILDSSYLSSNTSDSYLGRVEASKDLDSSYVTSGEARNSLDSSYLTRGGSAGALDPSYLIRGGVGNTLDSSYLTRCRSTLDLCVAKLHNIVMATRRREPSPRHAVLLLNTMRVCEERLKSAGVKDIPDRHASFTAAIFPIPVNPKHKASSATSQTSTTNQNPSLELPSQSSPSGVDIQPFNSESFALTTPLHVLADDIVDYNNIESSMRHVRSNPKLGQTMSDTNLSSRSRNPIDFLLGTSIDEAFDRSSDSSRSASEGTIEWDELTFHSDFLSFLAQDLPDSSMDTCETTNISTNYCLNNPSSALTSSGAQSLSTVLSSVSNAVLSHESTRPVSNGLTMVSAINSKVNCHVVLPSDCVAEFNSPRKAFDSESLQCEIDKELFSGPISNDKDLFSLSKGKGRQSCTLSVNSSYQPSDEPPCLAELTHPLNISNNKALTTSLSSSSCLNDHDSISNISEPKVSESWNPPNGSISIAAGILDDQQQQQKEGSEPWTSTMERLEGVNVTAGIPGEQQQHDDIKCDVTLLSDVDLCCDVDLSSSFDLMMTSETWADPRPVTNQSEARSTQQDGVSTCVHRNDLLTDECLMQILVG